MNLKRMTAALLTMLLLATGAEATPRLVVVELFTSQGCSSCPPADKLLRELATVEDVIPLALHVDYWDYIGWKDIFANPAYSERQRAYARAAGHRKVYTPQMVVAGEDHIVGTKPMKLVELIDKHRKRQSLISISATRNGNVARIEAQARSGYRKPMVLQLVRYRPEQTVAIGRGENRGRTITYSHIVTELIHLRDWNGSEPLVVESAISGDEPAVVLLQRTDHGPIVAATHLR